MQTRSNAVTTFATGWYSSGMHDFRGRYGRFLTELETRGLDGFLVRHRSNLTYLYNFTGSAGLACCLGRETILLVDSRYHEQARATAANCTPRLIRGSFEQALEELLNDRFPGGGPRKRLGLESAHTSCDLWLRMQTWTAAVEWIPEHDLIETLRTIKEPSEIDALTRAFELAQRAYARFLGQISPGMAEVRMAGILEMEMRNAGGEGAAFSTIVASGPRSSLPHGVATGRIWGEEELLLIDFGIRSGGYSSDLTRIQLPPGVGKPEIFDIVSEAQHAALDSIRPGVQSSDVDRAARQVIEEAGHGDHFQHSTGHGLGLEVHELPRISPIRPQTLEPGMVFTVEPGIYLPGRMGVRIEDVVAVTETGYRLLSDPDR